MLPILMLAKHGASGAALAVPAGDEQGRAGFDVVMQFVASAVAVLDPGLTSFGRESGGLKPPSAPLSWPGSGAPWLVALQGSEPFSFPASTL